MCCCLVILLYAAAMCCCQCDVSTCCCRRATMVMRCCTKTFVLLPHAKNSMQKTLMRNTVRCNSVLLQQQEHCVVAGMHCNSVLLPLCDLAEFRARLLCGNAIFWHGGKAILLVLQVQAKLSMPYKLTTKLKMAYMCSPQM
jgi:hypothetical protein